MDALTALRLQIEWGVDETLATEPVDRLRAPVAPAPVGITRASTEIPARPAQAAGSAAKKARSAAAAAASLEELRAVLAGFDVCPLRDTATSLVFADGTTSSGLLLIAEPPDEHDDRAGRPLAGPPGAYLDKMLASIGLERARLLTVPVIPWRPPGGRPPSQAEIAVCLPFLHRLIALVRPRRAVLLGPTASRALGVAARRSRPASWVEATVADVPAPLPCLPSLAPAHLLRMAAARPAAWADLRLLRRTLDADITDK